MRRCTPWLLYYTVAMNDRNVSINTPSVRKLVRVLIIHSNLIEKVSALRFLIDLGDLRQANASSHFLLLLIELRTATEYVSLQICLVKNPGKLVFISVKN
mmetsp:Transcript_25955/g.50790  ORF Transcript_25955/g.50790 Transcript_25955/m.50790 type:complete len:100 (+) Transcript_25955:128-427(+)